MVKACALPGPQEMWREAVEKKTAKAYGAIGGSLSGKIGDNTCKASGRARATGERRVLDIIVHVIPLSSALACACAGVARENRAHQMLQMRSPVTWQHDCKGRGVHRQASAQN